MRHENCLFCICLLEYYLENNELYQHSVIISGPRMQLLQSGFDSRHRHVAGKWSFEVGWWSFRSSKRIETVDAFDILVRIKPILARLWEKSASLRNGVWFMASLGEMPKLWELFYLQESAQLCVLHNYYIQIYINLCLVVSPSRAPPSQIYLWDTFRRPTNVLAFLVTTLYMVFTAYKTKLVFNMIIKRNLKNKCIISISAVRIRLCSSCALCLFPEIRTCAHTIWDCGG